MSRLLRTVVAAAIGFTLVGCRCGVSESRQVPEDVGAVEVAPPWDARTEPLPPRDIGPLTPCNGGDCGANARCYMNVCIADNGTCTGPNDCGNDTRCTEGICVPFGVPANVTNDPSCIQTVSIDGIRPAEQCRWSAPGAGDPYPTHTSVMSTPMLVDFDFDNNERTRQPSLVFISYAGTNYGAAGVVRVVDGATCTTQFSFQANAKSPAQVALADITRDGRADVIVPTRDGGLTAHRFNPDTRQFEQLWRSAVCSGGDRTMDAPGSASAEQWAGPEVHDIDDDGVPEILYGRNTIVTYDANGCQIHVLNQGDVYSRGLIPVVSDVDADLRAELITGRGVYEWDRTTRAWQLENYFTATAANVNGHVAVADFGSFPLASQGGMDCAEIAVVSEGMARIQTIEGNIVFGPFMVPGGGQGGPPTIADFDGDGRREFATAGRLNYAVFDLDCVAGGDAARCNGNARTDGVLWSKTSQDASSNVTGSSVFDFDANGAAEVVYADECFVRVYDGRTGNVLFSAPRSSATTYDNPIVADVDGDFRTEIAVTMNPMGCAGEDPHAPGVRSIVASGVVVYRDVMDRWASSRSIWNQHGYSVSNVGDRGEIPRTSQVRNNWMTPTLNNYRQNVQGGLSSLGTPDLTTSAVADRLRLDCAGTPPRATLVGRVCNRGQLPMAAGFVIEFRENRRDGTPLCRASSPTFLDVGQCDEAQCDANLPADRPIDVYVIADPDQTSPECHEGNNFGFQPNVACNFIP